ncbi:hypothetical protein AK88_02320 [Plasmodium fragile]|uniref:Poly(A) RNA polymerase mitochondrial-like central palm domain-containing protein n=1 Tax=Plasmodium fragile TaxID=5857 RepID=A0A0D9QLU1_PLAFR|nr:uncharacterized protein AK88_02320 [Plasmodium fragile]KJP88045.1 hypothetical protein AK88_02320 [Plasmodium fragile]
MTKGKQINREVMGRKVKLSKKRKFAKKMEALKGKLYSALGERLSDDERGKRPPMWEKKLTGWGNRGGREPPAQPRSEMGQKRQKRVHNEEDEEEVCRSDPYRNDLRRGKTHPRVTKPDGYNALGRQEHKVKHMDGVGIGKRKRGTPHHTQLTWVHGEHEKSIIDFMQKNGSHHFNNYLDDLKKIYFCTGRTSDTYRMMIRDMDTNMRSVQGVKQRSTSAPPSPSSPPCELPVRKDQVMKGEVMKGEVKKEHASGFVDKQYLVSSTIELLYNLGKEVMHLTHLMKPRRHEVAMREKLVKQVEVFIRGTYPQVYILIFGSCNTDLDLYNSDMDICIYNSIDDDRTNVRKLYNEMKRNKLFKNASIKQIIGAKVPIVKCFFTHLQISIDFSFNQVSAIVSTVQTQRVLKKNPLIKYIIIFFKILLSVNDLNDAFQGGISSFKLFLIMVKFMQEHSFVFYGKNTYLYVGEVVHKFVSYLSLFKDKSQQSMASFFSAIYKYNPPTQTANQATQCGSHAATPRTPTIEFVKRKNMKVIKKLFSHIFCKLGLTNTSFNENKGDLSFEKLFQVRQCMKEALYSLSDVLIYLVRKKNKNICPEFDDVIFADALSIVAFFHFLREERLNRFLRDYYALLHQRMLCLRGKTPPDKVPLHDDALIEVCEEPNGEVTQNQHLPPEGTLAQVNTPNDHLEDPHDGKDNHSTDANCPLQHVTHNIDSAAGDQLNHANGLSPLMSSYFKHDSIDEVQANVNRLYLAMGHKTNNHNRLVKKVCSKLVIMNSLLDLNKVLSNRFHYHQIFLPSPEERKCKGSTPAWPEEGDPQDQAELAALKRHMLASLVRFKKYDPSEVMGLEIKSEFFVNTADTVF